MADNVVSLLQASIDPKQHREAESALRQQESQPGFSLLLLQITASDTYPETTRLSSALCFKNLVRRLWTDEDGNHKLPADEVATIKRELVGLMVASPARIQAQLGDAISVIADSDFPDRWTDLVDNLVQRLSPDNAVVSNGVLQVAHSIFKRWRPLYRSDELFTEINNVLTKFAVPFLSFVREIDGRVAGAEGDKAMLQMQFTPLDVSMNLFYDLTIQDLPPTFEDNLEGLCQFLLKYLAYDNPLLHTGDDAESGVLDNVKAAIFEVLTMWVQKYEDAVAKFIPQLVETSWTLLTTLGPQTKYDLVSSRALHFLTSIASHQQHANNFDNDETLSQIVERVILPNVSLRESDIEMFEDEPIEFTRRDLEGSDSETRRRAATDFLRQLLQQMPQRVTMVVNRYIHHYLDEYSQDAAANWRSKDTAIYLFSSIAAIGQVTSSQGVKTTNPHVAVVDFFQQYLSADLTSNNVNVLLQVDAIKYLYMFRSKLTPPQWQGVFTTVVRHLASTNFVLHTYSAIVVDRVLNLTDEHNEPVISRETLKPVARDIIQRLFLLVEKDSAAEKVQENEFLMRCIMRVLIVLKEDVTAHTDFLLTNFINILRVIRHNPSNPRFYYFLFESIGALIRFAGPSQSEILETRFYEPFFQILQENVQEFVPYVFQLFAALLEANPSASLSQYYESLIAPVLAPTLWEFKGNTPALVRLLSSLVSRGAPSMIKNNQVEPTLGIFQKLISSKVNDAYGFDLLETILISFPPQAIQQYLPTIFNLLLTRLANAKAKTDSFQLRFVRLYHFISARTGDPDPQNATVSNGSTPSASSSYSTDSLIAVLESIQEGVFAQIYPPIILPDSQKFTKPLDRKLAVISFTKTIGDSDAFATRFAKGWARSVEALLALMVNPPVITPAAASGPGAAAEGVQEQDVEDLGFGVGFTALTTIRQPAKDEFPDVGDLKTWISGYLKQANERHGGRIGDFIGQRLSGETQQAFVAYLQG